MNTQPRVRITLPRLRAQCNLDAWLLISLGLLLFGAHAPLRADGPLNLPLLATMLQLAGFMFTVAGLLDQVYCEVGYFLERNESKVFEGASGAAQIAKLADSYGSNPPAEVDGSAVIKVRDFRKDEITDEEGDIVLKEKMLFVDLADGRSFAVRPSGTEPKIKYYMFGRSVPAAGQQLSAEELTAAKAKVSQGLASMWAWLDKDIDARLA